MRPINLRGLAVLTALVLPTALITIAGTSGAAEPDGGSLTATALPPADRVEGSKAASSALARTSPGLLKRTDSTLVPVMIKLDQDALASYQGGVSGLAATSPSVTGHKLNPGSKASRAYEAYLARNERHFAAALAVVAPRATVRSSLRVVYGGVSALVPANRVKDILRIDGVVAVQADRMEQPLTDSSAAFLDAAPVYAKLGGTANAGQGLIYGNLDTGVWPEHPSFADLGILSSPPGPARVCDFGDNPLTPANDPFVCNNKLIGGRPFLATYLSDPDRAQTSPSTQLVTATATAPTRRPHQPATSWPVLPCSAPSAARSPAWRPVPG